VNFEAQVDFTNAARGEFSIVAPFSQVVRVGPRAVTSRSATKGDKLDKPHPIHQVLAWHTKLERGEVQHRAALAKQLGLTRAAVTKNLKLLTCPPKLDGFQ